MHGCTIFGLMLYNLPLVLPFWKEVLKNLKEANVTNTTTSEFWLTGLNPTARLILHNLRYCYCCICDKHCIDAFVTPEGATRRQQV